MPTIYLLSRSEYTDDLLPGYAVGKLGLIHMAFRHCCDNYNSKRRDLGAMPFKLTDHTLTVLDDDDPITFHIHPREPVA